MASPRTMFTGSIQVGLVPIPITVGKATSEERESSLVQVNVFPDGNVERILKTEHLASGKKITNKQHAVERDGQFRVFKTEEFEAIETATKSPVLEILDVKPLDKLPLMYSTGAYYVRHNEKAKMSAKAFKALCLALGMHNLGAVVKWGNSTREKLAILSVESGVMILRVIPFVSNIRPASKSERVHWREQVSPKETAKMVELLQEIAKKGTPWTDQIDEGLKMRQTAVDRILKDEPVEPPKQEQEITETDFFELIDKAIEEVRS